MTAFRKDMEIIFSHQIPKLFIFRTKTQVNWIKIKTPMVTNCSVSNRTGIHYVGEMKNNTINKLLVEQLTEGQLQWSHLIDPNDVVSMWTPLNLLSLVTISSNLFPLVFVEK